MRRSGRLQLGLGAALGAALGCAVVSRADPAGSSPPVEQQKAEKEMELRGVEDTIRASEDQRRALESQLESMRADRARLSAALNETTAKVQDAERGEAAAMTGWLHSMERPTRSPALSKAGGTQWPKSSRRSSAWAPIRRRRS